jgi:hypothetical protein
MSIGRLFDEVTIPYGDSQTKAMKITCGCGAVGYFPHERGSNRKPPNAAAQHFQNIGWQVGNAPKKDVCPDCLRKPKRKEGTTMATTKPVAEAPREMTRDDRRIINDKLDSVYSQDAYKAPWTDSAVAKDLGNSAVAKDLGVPRDWVAQVRDQFFGPAGSNPLFDDYLAQRDALKLEYATVLAEQKALGERFVGICGKIDEIERIGKRIEREIGR